MEIREKNLKNLKLSKKQLNYQNNLTLLIILTSSSLPPTEMNIVLNVWIENKEEGSGISCDVDLELRR